jgi:phage gp36-like protein
VAYIGTQDLIDELGEGTLVQLTDDGTGEEPTINEARVLKAIESAQGIFDSYARSRYSLPVPVTTMVKSLNLDLAIFHLYKSRTSIAKGVYDVRRAAYEDAMKLLKAISAGQAGLDVPAAEETKTNPATPDRVLTNAGNAKFTDDKLKGF